MPELRLEPQPRDVTARDLAQPRGQRLELLVHLALVRRDHRPHGAALFRVLSVPEARTTDRRGGAARARRALDGARRRTAVAVFSARGPVSVRSRPACPGHPARVRLRR
jgi:hypothetical protein